MGNPLTKPRGVASLRYTAGIPTERSSIALVGTGAVAAHVWARATSVARMRTGTISHAKGTVGNAAETHALRLAASVASRRVRRVDGTPSARAPSAELNRSSAGTAQARVSSALRATSAAATSV